ncbi:hypothetical protein L228DRAFT_98414 [Xylona heveae TC161]|uniref:Uncharacterized protein n=1 Tax=Xylona heveae (strain CBS 132557 / TC161) TaxID=1328760 RepID=A0A165I819_XYLHT|nr:hypothetical protein L228DRAFT_98414 [Xylona heveae TC161]KZF24520.1 hypothetical protein L228DRAFT_98414 [Xylona heveae TC161]
MMKQQASQVHMKKKGRDLRAKGKKVNKRVTIAIAIIKQGEKKNQLRKSNPIKPIKLRNLVLALMKGMISIFARFFKVSSVLSLSHSLDSKKTRKRSPRTDAEVAQENSAFSAKPFHLIEKVQKVSDGVRWFKPDFTPSNTTSKPPKRLSCKE